MTSIARLCQRIQQLSVSFSTEILDGDLRIKGISFESQICGPTDNWRLMCRETGCLRSIGSYFERVKAKNWMSFPMGRYRTTLEV